MNDISTNFFLKKSTIPMSEQKKRNQLLNKKRKDLRDDLLSQLSEYYKGTDLDDVKEQNKKSKKKKVIKAAKKLYKKAIVNDVEVKQKELFKLKQSKDIDITLEKSILLDDNKKEKDFTRNKIDLTEVTFISRNVDKRRSEVIKHREQLEIFYSECEIVDAIKENLIVVIQGGTGCGKSIQIPQMLIEHGFIRENLICITQPRRINCVNISNRINYEMNEDISAYRFMFEDTTTVKSKLILMTEGTLISEIQKDFLLTKYDVIIIDEIHERSVNADILISLLSKILIKRKEMDKVLRLVLMSATFMYFNEFSKIVGPIEFVKLDFKKKFSVKEIYLGDQIDYIKQIYEKIVELLEKDTVIVTGESMLIFLPTKANIYSLKGKLIRNKNIQHLINSSLIEILPLHSSLSKTQQYRVFDTDRPFKIILGTNIAETSITIPNLSYVIDSGRFLYKHVEKEDIYYKTDFISKSSAIQRKGRLGRTKDGIIFRCFSNKTYVMFKDATIPQIHTDDIYSQILSLKALGVNNMLKFPWVENIEQSRLEFTEYNLQKFGFLNKFGNITEKGHVANLFPINTIYANIICTVKTISYNILALISMLSLDVEIFKIEETAEYFEECESDYLVYLKIYKSYLESSNKSEFSTKYKMSPDVFVSVEKLTHRLLSVYTKSMPHGWIDGFIAEINMNTANEDVRQFVSFFSKNKAVKHSENIYIYKGGEVYKNKNSIETFSEKVIFEHIFIINNKRFMKNITNY